MLRALAALLPGLLAALLALATPAARAALSEAELAARVQPPLLLGQRLAELPAWELHSSGGSLAGYIFESAELAPIPGFSGAPMNLLIAMDSDGQLLDVQLISQNEPVFVSGLGEAPLHIFLRQYAGKSLGQTIKVDSAYASGQRDNSGVVHIDGVTKATASVRIANESIFAAALQVARARIGGVASGPAARPRADLIEVRDWSGLLDAGLISHRRVLNREVEALFAETRFAALDDIALDEPDALYGEFWVADLSVPGVAYSLISERSRAELARGYSVAAHDEGILVMSTGRHPLLSEHFVRNTTPDRIAAEQNGYPIALRDADLELEFLPGVPEPAQYILLRFDTRMGFDPGSPWTLKLKAVRQRGMLTPQVGVGEIELAVNPPARYYQRPEVAEAEPLWLGSWRDQAVNLALLAGLLAVLVWALLRRGDWLARQPALRPLRLAALAVTLGFIGWYGQAQLSIVTPLGVLRALAEGGGLAYLLYDPLSLLLWLVVLASLPLWGRGLFCGWLCPYGALQEFAHAIGRALRLPQLRFSARWDRRLKRLKYVVLAVLAGSALMAPAAMDALVEVEPFKTAITLGFERAWPFVLYAALWLLLGLFLYKGFCRYLCPLGGALALFGRLRRRDWIARRAECGSPCQLCRARCEYAAIERDGSIDYDECFACLDCVTIYHDASRCAPLLLQAKRGRRQSAPLTFHPAPGESA